MLDTNPRAWSLLADTLPLSKAIANILVFINAHLAFNYANQVAVIASHSTRAQFLYPTPLDRESVNDVSSIQPNGTNHTGKEPNPTSHSPSTDDANKYRPFLLIEQALMTNLRKLIDDTSPTSLSHTNTTLLAGALTLSLSYINKHTLALSSNPTSNPASTATSTTNSGKDPSSPAATLQSRILVISVSSDLSFQYIPIMNCIFAAQRLRIPIDTLSLSLSSPSTFLQQASDATSGTYLTPSSPLHVHGLLQYLLMAFLPDSFARKSLVPPSKVDVDFRAACFCHKKVVSTGYVCSICLSIFCEPLAEGRCLTCGTYLKMEGYGQKPRVVPRKKAAGKKRKKLAGGATPGTPGTPGTPMP